MRSHSRILVALVTTLATTLVTLCPLSAQARESQAPGNQVSPQNSPAPDSAWVREIRDYAAKSLGNGDALSVAILPLDGPGRPQYMNADRPMSPGSIVKMVTTYAALDLLGPDYRWDTDFLVDGTLAGDTLKGNLYVRFGGDPKLTIERLWTTLGELRGMGISRITGDLVLDGSYFRLKNGQPDFADNGDNPNAPFLVEPSGYLTNLNLVHFQASADERGVRAWGTPALPEVRIDNQLTAVPAATCPGRKRFEWEPVFEGEARVTVRVTGDLPRGCRTDAYLSLLPPERYSASLIRTLLAGLGVSIAGKDRLDETPENTRLLLETTSPDLATMVRDVNKWSSNVMARQILLGIGAEARGEEEWDDREAGLRALRSWLAEKGIDDTGLVLENGAGLTRKGRITTRQALEILRSAWRSPVAPDLMSSLPIIAMDGTMAHRLRNTGLAGQGRIKTGSLDHVRSIAGFARDKRGTTWAVAAVVNNNPAWNGQGVLDRVLYSLYFHPPVDGD